ncbi:MAG: HmuY family protein [Bacteroidales bacterium]|nr:HmuY family protein [Bacteroidales bacterium]
MTRRRTLWLAALALLTLAAASSCEKKGKDDPQPSNQNTEYTVNASAYDAWVYYSLSNGEVVGTGDTSKASGYEWCQRTDWDLAFHRYDIRTNSGTSGHQGGICATKATTLADLTALPAAAQIALDTVQPGGGMGGGTATSQSALWAMKMAMDENGVHTMPPTYEPTEVYIMRSADGKLYKIQFTSYTKVFEGSPMPVSGHVSFEYDALSGATPRSGYIDAHESGKWQYYSLAENKLVGTGDASNDTEWFARTDWDFALNRFNIRTNSGTSNSKPQGGIHTCGEEVTFDGLTAMPTTTNFEQDSWITSKGMGGTTTTSRSKAPSCKLIMSTMPPGYEPTKVYIVRTADGKSHYKVWFFSYQSDKGASGHLKFHMAKL